MCPGGQVKRAKEKCKCINTYWMCLWEQYTLLMHAMLLLLLLLTF